jgi:predicted nucleotidyltransferase
VSEKINFAAEKLAGYLPDVKILFSCFRGSIAHGMYVPSLDPNSVDDDDYFACVLAPREHYLGLTKWGSSDTKEIFEGNDDVLAYEFRKLVNLLLVCNPNVMSFLWMDSYIHTTPAAYILINHRDAFVSKEAVFKSFNGYAYAQLQKMVKSAHRGFRGEKRKELYEQFGYDTKHASHCMRLLRMGDEFLRTGNLRVNRSGYDADELLDIKKGKWTQVRVEREANELFKQLPESLKTSPLRDEPNRDLIEQLTMKILGDYLK